MRGIYGAASDKPHEECGVFGVSSHTRTDAARVAYYGLYALQHRGQESCGIVVNRDGSFTSHKDTGLVSEVFTDRALSELPAAGMAVAHVRYGTTGGNSRLNCQPIEVNHLRGKMALAHNGNISNAYALRTALEAEGAIFHTTSDTEIIAYMITRERLHTATIEEAVRAAMARIEGAYSLIIMTQDRLIAVRDPHAFRPLCYGRMPDGTYVVASESCALAAVGAAFVRDVRPGEILSFREGEPLSFPAPAAPAPRPCIFEYIYFSRPDSVVDGRSVHLFRRQAGAMLAKTFPAEADLVIGVPDSGLDAAMGFAAESGIPYGVGLIKNRYIGRTFIAPGQDNRLDLVKIKLSPIRAVLEGKRVVLVDDSIVRGTTSRRIVHLLREAGAREIHMRISAPPFLHPCYYGTDIDSEEHLIACRMSVPEIADTIGVDSLGYLPLSSLGELLGSDDYCAACFDGHYPTAVPAREGKDQFE